MASFHPLHRIRQELKELVRAHGGISQTEAREEMLRFLKAFRLPQGEELLDKYAFELSGGICQRVSIAMAMSLHPRILFADEPTSALDVTVQKLVAEELLRLRETEGTSLVVVSHNMGVISYLSDTVLVMYAGIAVETGSRQMVIQRPLHPYTQALIQAIPRMDGPLPARQAGRSGKSGGAGPAGQPNDSGVPVHSGCPYGPRCPRRTEQCLEELPPLREAEPEHTVRCWHL